MKFASNDKTEILIRDIEQRIESIKVQYNLFFSGEIRIPPEREREELERKIRNMMHGGQKSARANLLLQNISSRFYVYNNMWMKRLNEIETGVSVIRKKKTAYTEKETPKAPPPPSAKAKAKARSKTIGVSLNREDSFDKFFDSYAKMAAKDPPDKEKVINSIKTKLITSNLIDAKVNLSVVNGKLKVKIKEDQ